MARHAARFAAALAVTAIAAIPSTASAASHHPAHAHAGAHHHRHHPHIVHRANQAAQAGDRHVAHHEMAKHAPFGAPVFPQPEFASPYPYAGRLSGDGILGTGFFDSNVMRAWGVVRN